MPKYSNGGRIDFTVGYNVDKNSLQQVLNSLSQLSKVNIGGFAGGTEELKQMRTLATDLKVKLQEAFNVKLNSLNIDQFYKSITQAGYSVEQIQSSFSKAGAQGRRAFLDLSTSVLSSNLQLKQTNSLINQMGTTMMNTVKWGIASRVFNGITQSVQQAFTYVKSLDSALTDIRIVTGQSREQMASFAEQANRAATALGKSTMDYTKAALTFYQQGLSDQDVQARTQATLMAQNITGAGSQMADYLTAVWNGYRVANEEAELYVDKLAAVADSSASNMSQLAVAMSKVAATANALGVPVDKLNAQIATIVATTRQAPQSVGNALKTIYARINDIKTGSDEAQVSLGNYSEQMAILGFNVLDANGNLRDTGDVIDQVGAKWSELSREQQIYLARTMAGQRQYNNLIALFDNWGKYTDLVNVSMNAQGATMEKNSRYMESLEAHLNQLGTAQERLKSSLVDSDSFKGLVDLGTQLTTFFANFIQSIGGGGNALLMFGSIATQVFSGIIAKEITGLITNSQIAKDNLAQLQADIQITRQFGKLQGFGTEAIHSMVEAKQGVQQYYSILSTQQINAYQNEVKTLGELKSKEQEYQRQAQTIDDLYGREDKLFSLMTKENDLIMARKSDGSAWQGAQVGVEEFISQLETVEQKLKSFNAYNPTSATNNLTKLNNFAQNLKDSLGTAFDDLASSGNLNTILEQPFDNATKQANQLRGALLEVVHELRSIDPSKYAQLSQKAREFAEQGNMVEKSLARQREGFQQLSTVTSFVKMTAGLGQVASGIKAITNLTKVWNNQNLSAGEKILQTFTSLSMTSGMLLSGLKNLKTALFAVTAEQAKSIVTTNLQTIADNKETIAKQRKLVTEILLKRQKEGYLVLETAETGAIWANIASLEAENAAYEHQNVILGKNILMRAKMFITKHPALVLGAAIIGILTTVVTLLNAGRDAAKKNAEEMGKAAKEAADNYNKTKEAYDSLKSSIEDYRSSQEAIKKLTIGTQEWRDAIRQANASVLQLMKNYPELTKYISNENGQLVISEEGQNQLLQQASNRADQAYRTQIALNQRARQAQIESDATDLGRKAYYYNSSNKGAKVEASSSDTLEVIKELISIEDGFSSFDSNTQTLAEYINKQTGVDEKLIQGILSNTKETQALKNSIRQNSLAIESENESIVSNILKDNNRYKRLSDRDKDIITSLGGAEYQQYLDQATEKWTKILVDDVKRTQDAQDQEWGQQVLNAMRQATGDMSLQWAENSIQNGDAERLYAFRSEGATQDTTYSARFIASTMAATQAIQAMGGSANDAFNILSKFKQLNFGQTESEIIKSLIGGQGLGDFNLSQIREITDKEINQYVDSLTSRERELLSIKFNVENDPDEIKAAMKEQVDMAEQALIEDPIDFASIMAKNTFKNLDKNQEFTQSTRQGLGQALEDAFQYGGKRGIKAFQDIFKTVGPESREAFARAAGEIDWTSFNAASDLTDKIREQGIEVDTSSEAWQRYIKFVDDYAKNARSAETASNRIQSSLSALAATKGLEQGKKVEEDIYKQIVANNAELNRFFKTDVNGNKIFNGNLLELRQLLKEAGQLGLQNYQDLSNAGANLAQRGVSNFIDSIDINQQIRESWLSGTNTAETLSGLQINQIERLSNDEAVRNSFSVLGINKQAFDEALNYLKQRQGMTLEELGEERDQYLANYEIVQGALSQVQGLEGSYLNEEFDFETISRWYSASAENIKELTKLYKEGKVSLQDYLQTYQSLEFKDLDTDQIEEYADYLQQIAKQSDQIDDSIAEDNQAAQDLAKTIMRMNKGVKQLSDNWDEWSSILKKSSIESQEYAQALNGVRNALADILDTNAEFISKDFITQHLAEIGRAAKGDEAAIDSLRYKLGQQLILDITVNDSSLREELMADYDWLQNYISQLDPGVEINLEDAQFRSHLDRLVEACDGDMTKIQQLFDGLTMQPDFEVHQEKVDKVGHNLITVSEPVGWMDLMMAGGIELGGATAVQTRTYQGSPYRFSETIDVPSIGMNGEKAQYKSIRKKATGSFNNSSSRNPGGKSKSGRGGGGSSKAPKTEKTVKTTKATKANTDPYKQINAQIKTQSNLLSELQKKDKNLVPRDRLKNLQQQNKAIEEQRKLLQKAIGVADTERRKAQLAINANFTDKGLGSAIWDEENSTIANYNDLLQNATDAYNKTIADAENAYNNWILDVYNKASAAQQQQLDKEKQTRKDNLDSAKETAKELYDAQKEALKNGQDALKNQKEYQKQLNELLEQQIELRIEASKVKVDASIDFGNFEREWLDFNNKFIKRLAKDSIVDNAKAAVDELNTYLSSHEIDFLGQQVDKYRRELQIIDAGGTSAIFGAGEDARGKAYKELQDYMKKYKDSLEKMRDLQEQVQQAYINALDQAKDKFDEHIEQYERLSDLIEHNVKLTQLLYGEQAYATLDKYYKYQEQINTNRLAELARQQGYWKSMMDNANSDEAFEAAAKHFYDVTDQINSALEDSIEHIAKTFENQLSLAVQRVNNKLSNGLGMDFLDQQWDALNNYDEEFLDNINSNFAITDVTNAYQQAIDDAAGNATQQQRLNKLMNDQLKILKEKDRLTEYDVERAKSLLDIEKQRMQLEDARNNKTKMRLRRDSQGNYTYQYVADEQNLAQLQQQLAQAENDLYNKDKENYRDNLNKLIDTYKDYLEEYNELTKQAAETEDEVLKEQLLRRRALLVQSMNQMVEGFSEENLYSLGYLAQSTGVTPGFSIDLSEENLEKLAAQVPIVSSAYQDLADKLGEQGLLGATKEFMDQTEKAVGSYQTNIQNTLTTTGRTLEGIANASDTAFTNMVNSISTYMDKTGEAAIKAKEDILEVANALNTVNDILNDSFIMTNAQKYAEATNQALTEALVKEGEKNNFKKVGNDLAKGNSDAGTTGNQKLAAPSVAFATVDTSTATEATKAITTSTKDMMTSYINGIQKMTSQIGKDFGSIVNGSIQAQTLNQNVTITAQFPNATSTAEIEQAFKNLVNIASQKASQFGS